MKFPINMKFPIKWHKDCLFNMQRTLYDYRLQLVEREAIVERLEKEVKIYQYQIERAMKEGKDGFDREKFNIPRKLK